MKLRTRLRYKRKLGGGGGVKRDNFSTCKHLASPIRDETTRTENACTSHDQDFYDIFFLLSALLSNM